MHSYDTDVFVLLVNLFSREQIQSSMTMESPMHGRSCIDIKETTVKQDHQSFKLASLCTNCSQLQQTVDLAGQMLSLWLATDTHWTCLVNRWQILIRLSKKQQLS